MYKKILAYIQRKRVFPIFTVFFVFAIFASAQTYFSSKVDTNPSLLKKTNKKPKNINPAKNNAADSSNASSKLIEIIWSKHYIKRPKFIPHVLKDSVRFFHQGAFLNCDSAYYDEDHNSFDAFSRVVMNQGDTLFLYGDYMHYDGGTRLAKVRRHVRLIHGSGTLFTDSLDYDRIANVSYYLNGGILLDSINKLTSYWGKYEPNIKLATFKDSVILTNPNFKLYTDLLKYNTDTKIAYITHPTKIVSDSGTIYSDRGLYNTITEKSIFLDQSTIINKAGNQILKGDSIIYDKIKGYGKVYGHMFLQDTLKHVILKGNYGFYNQITGNAYATDSAVCLEYSQGDTLYIHADTLRLIAVNPQDTLLNKMSLDTTKDSINNNADSLKAILPTTKAILKKSRNIKKKDLKKLISLYQPQKIGIDYSALQLNKKPHLSDSLQFLLSSISNHLKPFPLQSIKQIETKSSLSDKLNSINSANISDSTQQVMYHSQYIDSIGHKNDSKLHIDNKDTLQKKSLDTLQTSYHLIKGYHNVRFYRSDMQGVCDSMQFSSVDSILHMIKEPVLWSDDRQLTGDTIDIYMTDSNTIKYMHVINNSFSIQKKDTLHYDQLKSRFLKVFFEGQAVKRVYAEGNVISNVYPEDKNGIMVGILNHLESSFLNIFFKNGAFSRMVAWPKSVGVVTPFHLITNDQLRLKDFYWLDYLRPLNNKDIFRKVSRKTSDTGPTRLAIFDEDD